MKYICHAYGLGSLVKLRGGSPKKKKWKIRKNEGTEGDKVGSIFTFGNKNNSVANRRSDSVPLFFFPILQSQQTQARLQINVLLDAEFTPT